MLDLLGKYSTSRARSVHTLSHGRTNLASTNRMGNLKLSSRIPTPHRSPTIGNGDGDDNAEYPTASSSGLNGSPEAGDDLVDTSRQTGLDESRAPMSSIFSIFNDLTQRAFDLGFLDYLRAMKGRPVKIATMCSGTESPIFASRLIAEGMHLVQLSRLNVPSYCFLLGPFELPFSLLLHRTKCAALMYQDLKIS